MVNPYGITKFPGDDNFAIVLNYFTNGSLRDYLKENHAKMNLKDKVFAIWRLCLSLSNIHAKSLIHCDLHSGNILLYTNRCLITDFGLCGPVDKYADKAYGIIPYMAPELITSHKYSKATDIYSLGMLMWEIFDGNPPFYNKAHDYNLAIQLLSGLRPEMLPEIPFTIQNLIHRCWEDDPSKRPNIEEIFDTIKEQYKEILENEELIIEHENKKQTRKVEKSHPLSYNFSRIIDLLEMKSSGKYTYLMFT